MIKRIKLFKNSKYEKLCIKYFKDYNLYILKVLCIEILNLKIFQQIINYKLKLLILVFLEFVIIKILQLIIFLQDGIEHLNFYQNFLSMIIKQIFLLLVVLWYYNKAELYLLEPLFKGDDEIQHLNQIINILGTPPKSWNFGYFQAKRFGIIFPKKNKKKFSQIFNNASSSSIDLIQKILEYDHTKRIKAQDILQHLFFKDQNIFFLSNRLKGRSIIKNSHQIIPIISPQKLQFQSEIIPKKQYQMKKKKYINPLSLSSNLQGMNNKNKESILSLNLTQKLLQKNNSFTQPNKNKLFVKKFEKTNITKKLTYFQNKKKKSQTKINAKNQKQNKGFRYIMNNNKNQKNGYSIRQPRLNLDHLFIKQ